MLSAELVGIFLAAFGLDQFDELKLVAVPDAARDVVQEFPDGQGLFVGPVLRDLQGANGGIVEASPGGDLFMDGSPRARPGHAR